jgi:transposase-like protein
MRGFKSFTTAATTLAGIELAHRIRKRQFICQSKDRRVPLDLRRDWYAAIMV